MKTTTPGCVLHQRLCNIVQDVCWEVLGISQLLSLTGDITNSWHLVLLWGCQVLMSQLKN